MSEWVGKFDGYDDNLVEKAAYFLRLLDRGVALERVTVLAEDQGHSSEWLARAQTAQASVAHRESGTHATKGLCSAVPDDSTLSDTAATA